MFTKKGNIMEKFKKFLVAMLAVAMVFALAACGGGSGAEEEAAAEDEVLIGLTQSAYPPFAYLDENDEFQGLDPEVMREIDRRLDGYTIEIQTEPWDSQFIAVETGKATFMCNQVGITPERQEKYTMTDPYFQAGAAIIVKKGRDDIHSLEDLKGKTVWVEVGQSYTTFLENWNEENGGEIEFYYVENQMPADALYDLQTGKFDAFVNDPVMSQTIIDEKKLDVEVVSDLVITEDIGILFNKDNTELAEKFNAIIADMIADGTLSKLSEQYAGGDYIPK